jgi:hypothetical protein
MFHFVKLTFLLIKFHTTEVIYHMFISGTGCKAELSNKKTIYPVFGDRYLCCYCWCCDLSLSYRCHYSVSVTLMCRIIPMH